jgi:hypothetical protein
VKTMSGLQISGVCLFEIGGYTLKGKQRPDVGLVKAIHGEKHRQNALPFSVHQFLTAALLHLVYRAVFTSPFTLNILFELTPASF